LALWVQGVPVDWRGLHAGRTPRRVSLPTYPFDRERFWAPDERKRKSIDDVQSVLHPLLHRNTSDLDEQRFTSRFTGEEFFFSDHRVHGQRLLPAVAYLEMARAAIEHGGGEHGTGMFELRHVSWGEPTVADTDDMALHVALYPQGEDEIEFEIYSEGASARVVHSQGNVPRRSSVEAPMVALDDWADVRHVDGDACYAMHQAGGLDYLPAMRAIASLRIRECEDGRHEVLASLVLPEPVRGTADRYLLHPSLMDGALQAIAGLWMPEDGAAPNGSADAARLPFALDSLQIWAACGERATALIRERDVDDARSRVVDVDLCDERGRVAIRLRGLTSRRLAGEVLRPRTSPAMLMTPRWRARALAAAGNASVHRAARWIVLDAAFGHHLDALRAEDAASHWLVLPPVIDVASLADAWEAVFQTVRDILQGRPRDTVTLQLMIARHGDAWGESQGSLTGSVAGLLKSATLENPLFRGQVIELPTGTDAAMLGETSRSNLSAAADEVQVRYRDGGREVFALDEAPVEVDQAAAGPWKNGGVYWITGGAGGLGLIVARDIARRVRGARLVLTGRSALDASKQRLVASLAEDGHDLRVDYLALDVADADAVHACVRDILAMHGRLDGIVHSAGVIEDAFILRKSVEQLRAVWSAKVAGTVNLDLATRDVPLDSFLLFSSVAGVVGGVGQCDYATANAFLDAFARHRQRCVADGTRHGRTLSIDWPLWADGGMRLDPAMLRQLNGQGIHALETEQGLVALRQAWATRHAQVLVIGGAPMPSSVVAGTTADTGATDDETAPNLPPTVGTDADDLVDGTVAYLKRLLSQALKLSPDRIDPAAPMEQYGIDSILAVQLVAALQEAFGSLPKTLMFEYQSIDALAGYF
ncbi:SDR family NAD(P)-dependent oxidoreductase, partial [Xanthomonas arboricola]|uniref:SDR family NAD(P)-dependent oxidoreductase n=1 Tax=Xanthomonas arboricola TaxID=56448 RepID=UPI0016213EBF